MNDILEHHGILGMKWGVRRTPKQLGHESSGQKSAEGRKPSKSSNRKTRELSDEELMRRIQRLNMEEQYENLLARQKARSPSNEVKRQAQAILNRVVNRGVDKAIDIFIDKLSGKKGKFDINDYKNIDIDDIGTDVIDQVANWYNAASNIRKGRKTLGANN